MPLVHIVDDDPQVRAATSYLLASRGYPTEIYASAEDFLRQANLQRGCVLLDQRMPDLDGLGTMAVLAERHVAIPIIMMTGHGDLGTAVRAMKLGALDFIQKPYTEQELFAAITRALDLRAQERRQTAGRSDAVARIERLSPRELQVLRGLFAGLGNKAIARHLDLSPRTVEMHRASMMEDLGCSSLPEAIRLAIDAGITPLDGECVDVNGRAGMTSGPSAGVLASSTIGVEAPVSSAHLLEGTIDCIFLLDPMWRFTYLNGNAVKAIARGRDLLGTVLWESFPLSVNTLGWAELHRSAAERVPCRFQFFEPDVDCWFDVNVSPVDSGLQVAFRDITAERRTNVALQMSEETLRLALDAAGDGAWDWNLETGNIAMSARFIQRLGYAPGELKGDFNTVRALLHADDWPLLEERLRDHLDGRTETFACEYRLRRRDGTWCWNFDRGRVVARDPRSGAPLRMVGTACDVSERKAEEARANEALERLALAQSNAGAGIWDLDMENDRLQLCARSREMHGLSSNCADALTDAQWSACLHPDDVARAREALSVAVKTRSSLCIRYRTIAVDGRQRWVLGLGNLVPVSRDRVARFVGLNLDVTESMESTLALQHMQAEIARLSRFSAMGAIAATLAHELNQPLTAIAGFVGGIRRFVEECERPEGLAALHAIDGVERATRYAADIIRKLREQANDITSQPTPERLAETMGDAVSLCGSGAKSWPDIELDVDPAADAVLIDRIQIAQVVLNLLRNAAEASDASASAKPIMISTKAIPNNMALITISDGGGGVPEALKDDIFRASFTTKSDGMGLGLSISRTIVENHGGRIWVDANSRGGADFCFTVPRQEPLPKRMARRSKK